jgi:hypothetical protein
MTSKKKPSPDVWSEYTRKRLLVFAQVSGITVAGMAIIGGGGYLLDQQMGTFPKIFITSLVIAYPIIQLSLFRKFRKKISK